MLILPVFFLTTLMYFPAGDAVPPTPTASPRVTALNLTNAGLPSDATEVASVNRGIVTSFCPILACIFTPHDSNISNSSFFDHQRTSVLFQAITRDDGHSEEQNLSVITTIKSGYARPYAANTAYQKGDNTVVGNAVYRATSTGKTGDHTPPPSSRPSAAQGGSYVFRDGTVFWKWINDATLDSKVGAYIETNVLPGAGAAWGAAFNYHFKASPRRGNFFPGVEMDYINDSGSPCKLGVTDCTALRIAMGGNSVTEGLAIIGNNAGTYSSIWGVRLSGDKLASQSALEVDSAAPVGLSFGGSGIGGQTHAIATLQDVTTSPTSISILGTHLAAAISDQSKSRAGLMLFGSYTEAQIEGHNFIIYPDGSQKVASLTVSSRKGHQATLKYDDQSERTIIQSAQSTTATTLALNPSGGLVQAGPSGFSETLTTPPSSSAPCIQGQFTDDSNYHYVCVEKNKWKRVLLSSF